MNLFFDAALVAAGVCVIYVGFKVLQSVWHIALLSIQDWSEHVNAKYQEESHASIIQEREAALSAEAERIMESNPVVAAIVHELMKNPYARGKSNSIRTKLQAQLRKLVDNREVRSVMMSEQF